MTPQQIVGLASRLCAIWLGLHALQLAAIVELSKLPGNLIWQLYIFPLVHLAVALVLWFFPMVIAHALIPRTKFNDKLRLPAEKVVAVACVVLGLLVIFFNALPLVTRYLLQIAVVISDGQTIAELGWALHGRGLESIVQLLAGVFLITKAHAISSRLMRLPKETKENEDERADDAL